MSEYNPVMIGATIFNGILIKEPAGTRLKVLKLIYF